MLTIWAGFMPPGEITMRLFYLDSHIADQTKIDTGLKWLVKNKITGQAFIDWFNVDCKGSQLEMIRVLMSRIEGEKQLRRLFVGKDMRV